MSANPKCKWQNNDNLKSYNLQSLLSSLQSHILAYYTITSENICSFSDSDLLRTHFSSMVSFATKILDKAADILVVHPASLELLYNVLLDSAAGAMLFKILNSLLLMPMCYVKTLYPLILELVEPLNKFNQLLPAELLTDEEKTSSKYIHRVYLVLVIHLKFNIYHSQLLL